MSKKKVWVPQNCTRCGKTFTPWNVPQLLCGDPCRNPKKLTIEESNNNWINRKARRSKTRAELAICLKNNGCRVF